MNNEPFSKELEKWLRSKGTKTVAQLGEVTGERSFAITILFLMFLPALPLPTGGITHVFEAIAMLLALEMIIGRQTIWLPKRWRQLTISRSVREKILPFMIGRIRWFEKYSRPRLSSILSTRLFGMLTGWIILALTFVAFFAPPFSGLDTLPSLGVVAICLSLILEDFVLYVLGVVIGVAGVFLTIGLGAAITQALTRLL